VARDGVLAGVAPRCCGRPIAVSSRIPPPTARNIWR